MDVLRVGELAGRADGAAEELQRRRDRVGRGQMIDELGRDARILQVLLDQPRVFLVDLLGRGGFGAFDCAAIGGAAAPDPRVSARTAIAAGKRAFMRISFRTICNRS